MANFYLPGALDHPVGMTRAMVGGDPAAGETTLRYERDIFGNMTLVEGDVANSFTFTAREWNARRGFIVFCSPRHNLSRDGNPPSAVLRIEKANNFQRR